MTKDEKNWLIGGTVGTVIVMAFFLLLMSDWSPLYRFSGSNTQALIDSLRSRQSLPGDATGEPEILVLDPSTEVNGESPGQEEQETPTQPATAAPTTSDEPPITPDATPTPVSEESGSAETAAGTNTQKATEIDWANVDVNTIDFDNLDLEGADVFTSDQVIQLLYNGNAEQSEQSEPSQGSQ